MRNIGNTQTGATWVSLTEMSYIDNTQTQATLIILKSGKLVVKQELSWHSNRRDIGNTQT